MVKGSGGQESLVCCSPWGCKESCTTEQLNSNQWLRCCASNAGVADRIPGRGTRISHAARCSQKLNTLIFLKNVWDIVRFIDIKMWHRQEVNECCWKYTNKPAWYIIATKLQFIKNTLSAKCNEVCPYIWSIKLDETKWYKSEKWPLSEGYWIQGSLERVF